MHTNFIKKFFIYSLIGTAIVILFNFIVDPFEIYFQNPFKGFNHIKYDSQERLKVAVKIIQIKPKTLVFGTSRAAKGFNMETIKNYSENEAYYNAGLPGASFDEIYAYFLHALYIQPDVKRVILGLDFFCFNHKRYLQKDFSEERLFREDYLIKDLKNSLLTHKAFSASIETIFRSLLERPKINPIIEMGEKVYLRSMLVTEGNYKNYQIDQEKIQKFQSLVEICKAKSIDLKVLICPVKAVYWEFYHINGFWPILEELKRQLSAIHPIWDFSGYNPITSETLETEGKALYHEYSHFTDYTGSLLLKRMFGEASLIDSIGYLLTPDTVDHALEEIKKERMVWLKTYVEQE